LTDKPLVTSVFVILLNVVSEPSKVIDELVDTTLPAAPVASFSGWIIALNVDVPYARFEVEV